MEGVYHAGEIEIQKRVGEERMADANGRVITNRIIKGAINFIEKQPMVVVSSVDSTRNVWVSLLIGDYGFVSVPDPARLSFNKDLIQSDPDDQFYENAGANGYMGTLFIELATRRRFRINGTVYSTKHALELSVEEAYPNCPKYIQQRVISNPNGFQKTVARKTTGKLFTDEIKTWIHSADTFFVGSQGGNQQLDVSHRGGPPGFIEIMDDQTLKIPDYQGNSMYNTLGNILQNPNTGLLFIDFKSRRTLQLTGKAELLFDQRDSQDNAKTTGTGRYWTFSLYHWVITESQHNVNWEFLSYSPFNPSS